MDLAMFFLMAYSGGKYLFSKKKKLKVFGMERQDNAEEGKQNLLDDETVPIESADAVKDQVQGHSIV
jgi:hypothetical protein